MNEIALEGLVSALLVGEYENDRVLVRDIFRKLGWRLFEARDGRRAMAWLERNAVQVVIAEGRSAGAGWQRLLDALRDLPDPPQLVVTFADGGRSPMVQSAELRRIRCPGPAAQSRRSGTGDCRGGASVSLAARRAGADGRGRHGGIAAEFDLYRIPAPRKIFKPPLDRGTCAY